MSDEEVAACIRKSLLEHQQLLAHCNGDAAAEQYLTQFEKIVRELDAKDTLRPVMIHAQLVQKEQLERMKPLQMIPSFFAAHVWHWGDGFADFSIAGCVAAWTCVHPAYRYSRYRTESDGIRMVCRCSPYKKRSASRGKGAY